MCQWLETSQRPMIVNNFLWCERCRCCCQSILQLLALWRIHALCMDQSMPNQQCPRQGRRKDSLCVVIHCFWQESLEGFQWHIILLSRTQTHQHLQDQFALQFRNLWKSKWAMNPKIWDDESDEYTFHLTKLQNQSYRDWVWVWVKTLEIVTSQTSRTSPAFSACTDEQPEQKKKKSDIVPYLVPTVSVSCCIVTWVSKVQYSTIDSDDSWWWFMIGLENDSIMIHDSVFSIQ